MLASEYRILLLLIMCLAILVNWKSGINVRNAGISKGEQRQPWIVAIHRSCRLRAIPLTLALLLLTDNTFAGDFSGTVSLTSDYFWRGYSKSNGKASLQANAEYVADSGLYGGLWVASIDFNEPAASDASRVEWLPYVGYSFKSDNDWVMDFQLVRYIYDEELFNKKSDYTELYGFLHYRDVWTMEVSVADDTYNLGATSANIQLNGRYPLTSQSQAAGGLGYYRAIDFLNYDYVYWNLGYTYNYSRNFSVDARYFGTREGSRYKPHRYSWRRGLEIEDSRYVLTFSWSY
jgi:uncharacterized protein (TIGR02001 family)